MTLSSVKNEEMVVVGLGEMQVSNDPNMVLACLGLGSCIGISAYDPVARVGAMVHVVLPHGNVADCGRSPTKYANTALPSMINQMESKGAVKSRIVIKIRRRSQNYPYGSSGKHIGYRRPQHYGR